MKKLNHAGTAAGAVLLIIAVVVFANQKVRNQSYKSSETDPTYNITADGISESDSSFTSRSKTNTTTHETQITIPPNAVSEAAAPSEQPAQIVIASEPEAQENAAMEYSPQKSEINVAVPQTKKSDIPYKSTSETQLSESVNDTYQTKKDVSLPEETTSAQRATYIRDNSSVKEEPSVPETTEPVTTTSAKTNSAENKTSGSFKVVAYFPSWRENHIEKLDFSTITHVVYAFAIPTEDSKLLPLENIQLAKNVISRAHSNGAMALVSVGGWSYQDTILSSVFANAAKTEKKAKMLAQNIAELCDTYGFDGVDIDWEYPLLSDETYKNYEWLMKHLKYEMDSRGKLLTIAVSAGVSANGQYVYESAKATTDYVLSLVDWINIMAYDGGDGIYHSTYNFAVNCSNYWLETRGLSKNRVILGMPFYSRATDGGYTYSYSYDTIVSSNYDNYNSDVAYYNGLELHYNGYDTIQKKTEHALRNLAGIMIWEISHDSWDEDISLLSAIKNILK